VTPALGAEHQVGVRPSEVPVDYDYFTDAVPLRGDREQREYEERMRRLEQARPRKGRSVRLPIGAVAAVAVVLLAGALYLLGGSSAPEASDPRPAAQTRTHHPAAPVAAAPKSALTPAVAVRAARSRPRPHKQSRLRHRHHGRPTSTPVDEKGTDKTARMSIEPEGAEPDLVVPEATAEPESETTAEQEREPTPSPEPEPSPSASAESVPPAPSAPASSGGSRSSSSEADRQFGFGR
jgi:hypothetical protein